MPNRSPVKHASSEDSDRSTPIDFDAGQSYDNYAPPTGHARGIPRSASYGSDEGNFRRPRREKLCRSFMSTGYCHFGSRCNFIHNFPPGSALPPPSYDTFMVDSCPTTPISQAASFPCGPTHYRHEPYSLDAFVFFGDDEFAWSY